MSQRTFTRLPGDGYALLDGEGVRVEVRHLRREHHQLYAEVDVQCDWAGAQRIGGSLSCSDLNLSSQTARSGRAKYCAERARSRAGEFDWTAMIDDACQRVIVAERES